MGSCLKLLSETVPTSENENITDSSQFIIMNRAKKVYRRPLGKKAKKYAYSPTGSLPPSPIGGNSPPVLRKESFKRSRQALNRMWRRSCPASLEASLTRAVLDEAKSTYLSGSTFAVSIPNQDEDQIDASTP